MSSWMKVKDVEFLTQQENGRMQDDISSIKYDDKTSKIKMIEGKTCHPLGWFQLWYQIIHNDYYELQMAKCNVE